MKCHLVALIAAVAFPLEGAADDTAEKIAPESNHEDLGPNYSMVEMAATFSIDYKALVAGCLQGDNLNKRWKSMSVMLWLSAFGNFGGEYGEEHAGWIGEIMNKIGDESFAELVSGQPDVLRTAAGREIAYSYALFEPDAGKEEVDEFARRYPRTFKALEIGRIVAAENNRAEQISEGKGQPATAPESKPEGEENPKPESEVRSR